MIMHKQNDNKEKKEKHVKVDIHVWKSKLWNGLKSETLRVSHEQRVLDVRAF